MKEVTQQRCTKCGSQVEPDADIEIRTSQARVILCSAACLLDYSVDLLPEHYRVAVLSHQIFSRAERELDVNLLFEKGLLR